MYGIAHQCIFKHHPLCYIKWLGWSHKPPHWPRLFSALSHNSHGCNVFNKTTLASYLPLAPPFMQRYYYQFILTFILILRLKFIIQAELAVFVFCFATCWFSLRFRLALGRLSLRFSSNFELKRNQHIKPCAS